MPGQKVRRAAPQGMQPQGGSCSRLKFAPSRATQRALTPFCRRGSKNLASTQTSNYQLNLWEPGDHFLREEFNENSVKIDAAIASAAGTKAECGVYTGDGSDSRTFTFSFTPTLLLLMEGVSGSGFALLVRGQTGGSRIGSSYSGFRLAWGTNSVTLTSQTVRYPISILNESGTRYFYWAVS